MQTKTVASRTSDRRRLKHKKEFTVSSDSVALVKKRRKKRERPWIGGSAIGALLGLHPRKTPLDVYNEVLGLVPPEPENPHIKRGKALEPIAAKEFTAKTGKKVRRLTGGQLCPHGYRGRCLVHPEYDFLIGHIDYEVEEDEPAHVEPVEFKCPSLGAFSKYKRTGIPDYLIVQPQWYAGLMSAPRAQWGIFCADLWQIINFPVEFERSLYDASVSAAVEFWKKHVERRIPPPEGKANKELIKFDSIPGDLVRVDSEEYAEAMGLLYQLRVLSKDHDVLKEIARTKMKEALGGVKGKYVGPGGRIYWTMRAGKRSFDQEALAKAAPIDRTKLEQLLDDVLPANKKQQIIKLLHSCSLDLETFIKVGVPYDDFHPYFSTDESE